MRVMREGTAAQLVSQVAWPPAVLGPCDIRAATLSMNAISTGSLSLNPVKPEGRFVWRFITCVLSHALLSSALSQSTSSTTSPFWRASRAPFRFCGVQG